MKELGQSIAFRLRGQKSNRDAIGAAVTIEAEAQQQTKYLQAGSGFLSQHSKELCFGVGKVQGTVRASIRWPSGVSQAFEDLPINHRIEIQEGSDKFLAKPFAASPPPYARGDEPQKPEFLPLSSETWLIEPLSAPEFSLPDLAGKMQELWLFRGGALLLSFWATALPPCREQLRRSEEHTSELQSPCNLVCRLLLEKKKQMRPHRHAANQSPTRDATIGPAAAVTPPRKSRAISMRPNEVTVRLSTIAATHSMIVSPC